MATKKSSGKEEEFIDAEDAVVKPIGPNPSPIDLMFYDGPKIKLEGETGVPEVDQAIKEGRDPSMIPELMNKLDQAYSDDDLIKMVEDGEIDIVDLEEAETPFNEENAAKWLFGEITWGQLNGITMEEAYAMAELGYMQFEQGRYNDAQAIFEGLIITNPYDAYFHSMLGAIYARKDMQEEAAEEYTIAIELDPENIAAYVNRAEILLQHGEFEIAMDDLKNAIKLDQKGEDPSGIRARALAGATAAIIE